MSALDLDYQPISGTAALDPSVQAMRAQRRQNMMADVLFNLRLQQHQAAADKAQQAQTAETMAGEMPAWAENPDYQKPWSQVGGEVRQHFIDAYGGLSSLAPAAWNQTVRERTGNPSIGLEGLPETSQAVVDMSGAKITVGSAKGRQNLESAALKEGIDPTGLDADELREAIASKRATKAPPVPAQVRTDAVRAGVWKEGMSAEEAQNAMTGKMLKEGTIPQYLVPHAERFAQHIAKNPVLLSFAKQKEAYDALQSGFADPDSGGFGDMAMVEGFQRLVNPGAVVRVATIQQMQSAAGWLQRFDPNFQWNKAVQGDKLSPEARTRLKTLADSIFKKANAAAGSQMAGMRNLARTYGIPNPNDFVNATLTIVGQGAEGSPEAAPANATSATAQPAARIRMKKPDGAVIFVPQDKVEAAQQLGARLD